MTPSKTFGAPQPLNIAFPLGKVVVLRSEEGGDSGRKGTVGKGKKEGKKDAQKMLGYILAQIWKFSQENVLAFCGRILSISLTAVIVL